MCWRLYLKRSLCGCYSDSNDGSMQWVLVPVSFGILSTMTLLRWLLWIANVGGRSSFGPCCPILVQWFFLWSLAIAYKAALWSDDANWVLHPRTFVHAPAVLLSTGFYTDGSTEQATLTTGLCLAFDDQTRERNAWFRLPWCARHRKSEAIGSCEGSPFDLVWRSSKFRDGIVPCSGFDNVPSTATFAKLRKNETFLHSSFRFPIMMLQLEHERRFDLGESKKLFARERGTRSAGGRSDNDRHEGASRRHCFVEILFRWIGSIGIAFALSASRTDKENNPFFCTWLQSLATAMSRHRLQHCRKSDDHPISMANNYLWFWSFQTAHNLSGSFHMHNKGEERKEEGFCFWIRKSVSDYLWKTTRLLHPTAKSTTINLLFLRESTRRFRVFLPGNARSKTGI